MKYCIKCGTALEDGTRFCSQCGADQFGETQKVIQTPKKKNVAKKYAMMVGIPLLVLLIGFGLFKVLYKPTLDLKQYVLMSYHGYDSIGALGVEKDYEAMDEDIDRILPKNLDKKLDKIEDELDINFKNKRELKEYLESYQLNYDKTRNLYNGDTIHVSWDEEQIEEFKEVARICGFQIKAEEFDATVEGLKEVKTKDIFADAEITFDGTNGSGYGSLIYDGANSFEFENNGNLSNGDKVKVTISDSSIRYLIENKGYRPDPVTKEVEVKGLRIYSKNIDEFSENAMNEIEKIAHEKMDSILANAYPEYSKVRDLNNEAICLFSGSGVSSYGQKNIIIAVYKMIVDTDYERLGSRYVHSQEAYYPVVIFDVAIDENGDLIKSSELNPNATDKEFLREIKSVEGRFPHTFRYKGFASIEDLEEFYKKYFEDGKVTSKTMSNGTSVQSEVNTDDTIEDNAETGETAKETKLAVQAAGCEVGDAYTGETIFNLMEQSTVIYESPIYHSLEEMQEGMKEYEATLPDVSCNYYPSLEVVQEDGTKTYQFYDIE